MKKMKKVLVAVLACIVICGISVPVIAANIQKTGTNVEQKVRTRNTGVCNMILESKMLYGSEESPEETEPVDEEAFVDVSALDETADIEGNGDSDVDDTQPADEPAEEAPADEPADVPVDETPADEPADIPAEDVPADVTDTGVADTAATPVCPSYVDANGDGICDHCAHGGSCNNYVDYNGDGICDYCAHGGSCGNYVDANGDGVCDYCTHNGSGHCGNYVDSNGDGVCDNYTGGGNYGGGGGHHGGGHHGGHHW